MKRTFLIGLTIILCLVLMATPVIAADGGSAAVSGAAGIPGSTVYLTVSISGFTDADSFSISVGGDLSLDAGNSSWLRNDTQLQSFEGNRGVWATGEAKDLNGDIAKLAFTVPQLAEGQTNLRYQVSCTVLVKNDAETLGSVTATGTVSAINPATAMVLTPAELRLTLGSNETADLVATVEPANTTDSVVWSSSDASIVSVSGGKVTAHKAGIATITATAGSVSKTCAVTVICPHSNLKETPAKDASCTATGNRQYWTCEGCGVVLAADKTTVTSVTEQTLALIPHAGGTATCVKQAVCTACEQPYGELAEHKFGTSWSSNDRQHFHQCTVCLNGVEDAADHSFQWKTDKEATEKEAGLKHEECSVCGRKRNENTAIEKLDHAHTGITHHAAVKATCVAGGNVEYWTCSSSFCSGKYYGDEKCQLVLTEIKTTVDANNHTGGTEIKDAVAASCNKDGFSGDTYCLGCKALVKAGEKVSANGKHTAGTEWKSDEKAHWHVCTAEGCEAELEKADHDYKWKTDKKATEDETGLKHEECSVCGRKRNENTKIDRLPHAPKKVEGKKPTCTEEGLAEHFYCGNCGGYYASNNGEVGKRITKNDTVLPATGHTFDNEWISDEEGHWRFCDCGEMSEKESHEIEVVGAVESVGQNDGYTGDTLCTICEHMVAQGEIVPGETETPTEESTEPATEVPTEAIPEKEPDEQKKSGSGWLLIVAAVAAAGAVATGVMLPLIRKKRK